MGGESKSSTTQSSQTNPWAPTQGLLGGIIQQLGNASGNTGLTGDQNNALSTITANSNAGAGLFGPLQANYAQSLFNGGGALDQAGNLTQNLTDYTKSLSPYADPNYSTLNSPAVKAALDQAATDVTNSVNGQFAAAGRDLSGMNQQTLARGIAQAQAPIILNQANTDTATSRAAQDAIYNAGNTNAGILAGLQQQYLANQAQGAGAAGSAVDLQNGGANATLQADAQRFSTPIQNLGLLANIGIPIAGLGSNSTGQSNTTQQMSGAQQFSTIAGGLSSLFGGGGSGGASTAANIFKFISDRNAKEDIAQVGTLFDGTPVYRYRYKGDPRFQIGLIAQDVEKVTPEAVGQIGPYKAVDYKLATDKALEVA